MICTITKSGLSYINIFLLNMSEEENSTFRNLLYAVDQPFENIAVTFKGLVPEHNRFQAACTLMALLESSELQVCLLGWGF